MKLHEKMQTTIVIGLLALFGLRGMLPYIPSYAAILLFLAAMLAVTIIHQQQKRRMRMGDLAQVFKWISQEDIRRIVAEQRNLGLKFGEVAIRQGLLTTGQVEAILRVQKEAASMLVGPETVEG